MAENSKQQSERIVFICALLAIFFFGFLAIEVALEYFNQTKK